MIEGEFIEVLQLVGRKPKVPVSYLATISGQKESELIIRLEVASKLCWLQEHPLCCGMQSVYSLTDEGRRVIGEATRVGP